VRPAAKSAAARKANGAAKAKKRIIARPAKPAGATKSAAIVKARRTVKSAAARKVSTAARKANGAAKTKKRIIARSAKAAGATKSAAIAKARPSAKRAAVRKASGQMARKHTPVQSAKPASSLLMPVAKVQPTVKPVQATNTANGPAGRSLEVPTSGA
jgi:hypothetical protein